MSKADFDILLAFGEEREAALAQMLDGKTAECKAEHESRTHIFIEHESYGKPAGIAITKADYWAIETRPGWWTLVPTESMRSLWREALRRFGPRHGGPDTNGNPVGAAVPKGWLVNIPDEEVNMKTIQIMITVPDGVEVQVGGSAQSSKPFVERPDPDYPSGSCAVCGSSNWRLIKAGFSKTKKNDDGTPKRFNAFYVCGTDNCDGKPGQEMVMEDLSGPLPF